MEGSGVEGGRREGRDGKEREGNNALPHLKRAVAAYARGRERTAPGDTTQRVTPE